MQFALLPFIALLIVLPFPGTVALRLLCLTVVLATAVRHCHRNPVLCRHFPPARWTLLAWISICCLSLLYTSDVRYTLKELQNEIFYTMAAFFSFFVVGQRRHLALILLRSVAGGVLLIGGIALFFWLKNHFYWENTGLQGGTGTFASYIVTIVPALFFLSLNDNSPYWRYFAKTLIVFSVVLGFITLQRAVWPALVAEMCVAIYLLRRCGRIRLRKDVLFGLIALILITSVAALSLSNKFRGLGNLTDLVPSTQGLTTAIAKQNGSDGDPRLPYWTALFRTIADHPLIGAGFGQGMMRKAYPELIPPNFPLLWHAHNVFLNYAVQLGIPGALALIAMFFGFVRYYLQSIKQNPAVSIPAIAGIMLVVGVLTRNQTNDFFRRDLAILFWCLTGLFSALSLPKKNEPNEI